MAELEPGGSTTSWEREALEKVALAAITEQRRARKWGIFFKMLLFIYLFALLFIGMGWYAKRDISPGRHTALADVSGEPGWWFPQVVALDAARARRVGQLLHGLWACAENDAQPLAFDSALSLLVDELRPHARSPAPPPGVRAGAGFSRVIEQMRAQLGQR